MKSGPGDSHQTASIQFLFPDLRGPIGSFMLLIEESEAISNSQRRHSFCWLGCTVLYCTVRPDVL